MTIKTQLFIRKQNQSNDLIKTNTLWRVAKSIPSLSELGRCPPRPETEDAKTKALDINEQTDTTQINEFINLMLTGGLGEGAPRIIELILNAAMIVERNAQLHAAPQQRCEERTIHANGFKPRSLNTSMGKLHLAMHQARNSEEPFYTSLLEKDHAMNAHLRLP